MSLGEAVRRRAGSFIVDGFFQASSRLARLHPQANPARHGVEVIRDVAYLQSGKAEHLADIYRPIDRKGPLPTVLYVHGGGFRILSKDTHWIMALSFARRGYLVISVNYRLAPQHPYPFALEDISAAYEWTVKNAAAYGGDPSRLILAGESAGANLVTALTVAATYERPEPFSKRVFDTGVVPVATLPACGILQVSDSARFGRRRKLPSWLLDRLVEVETSYLPNKAEGFDFAMADPLLILESDQKPARPLPPFFIPCGTRDPLLDDSRRLAAALEKVGVANELQIYPGGPHAFHALVFTENGRAQWKHTFDFLDRSLPAAN